MDLQEDKKRTKKKEKAREVMALPDRRALLQGLGEGNGMVGLVLMAFKYNGNKPYYENFHLNYSAGPTGM
jgi:hypothetical protein